MPTVSPVALFRNWTDERVTNVGFSDLLKVAVRFAPCCPGSPFSGEVAVTRGNGSPE